MGKLIFRKQKFIDGWWCKDMVRLSQCILDVLYVVVICNFNDPNLLQIFLDNY